MVLQTQSYKNLDQCLPFVLHAPPRMTMASTVFFEFCQLNKDLRIERTAEGDVEIMPPVGGETGNYNIKITTQLQLWTETDDTGRAFDSSTGFILPSGAIRSPDASWVRKSRLSLLTKDECKGFLPLCPDFVVELRSPSDRIEVLKLKMQEYIANGSFLGWLLDPVQRSVYIYHENDYVECLTDPSVISGEGFLSTFTLDIKRVFKSIR